MEAVNSKWMQIAPGGGMAKGDEGVRIFRKRVADISKKGLQATS
jgi:hypothetical protein